MKIARNTVHHASAACVGCCIGQVSIVPDGLGLPNSTRTDAVTALTGFQFAIVSSQLGMPCVGTNAFETNDSGKSTTNATPCAASGFCALIPRQALAQLNA